MIRSSCRSAISICSSYAAVAQIEGRTNKLAFGGFCIRKRAWTATVTKYDIVTELGVSENAVYYTGPYTSEIAVSLRKNDG